MKRTICLIAALLLLVTALCACGGGEDAAQPLYAKQSAALRGELGQLAPAADAAALLDCLRRAGDVDTRGRETVAPPDDGAPGRTLRTAHPDDTVVAEDGGYIYMLDSYGLVTVLADGAQSRILSYTRVETPDAVSARRLFVRGDRAAVVCGLSDFGVDEDGLWHETAETLVIVLDLSDRAAPRETARTAVDGALIEAGFLGDALCLVSGRELWTLPEDDAARLLPWFEENGSRTVLRPADVSLPAAPGRAALTTVSALRLSDGRVLDAMAVADGLEAAVFGGDSLYLAFTRWQETRSAPDRDSEPPYTRVDLVHEARTELIRLRFDTGLRLAGGCAQEGALADAEALAVGGGYLRLALRTQRCAFSSYTDEKHGWTNYALTESRQRSVLLLPDAGLEAAQSGALTDVGGENGVRAACFAGDFAFFATEKPGDPIACADLSRPAAPVMGASLVLPGSTASFYAMDGGAVLALTESAAGDGVCLSVFDGSDPARMERTDRVTLRGGSPALRNPNALLADPETGLVGLPLAGEKVAYRLYRLEGGSLTARGEIALEFVPDEARSLLCGGLLYVCGPAEVYVIDPDSGSLLAAVSNAVG